MTAIVDPLPGSAWACGTATSRAPSEYAARRLTRTDSQMPRDAEAPATAVVLMMFTTA